MTNDLIRRNRRRVRALGILLAIIPAASVSAPHSGWAQGTPAATIQAVVDGSTHPWLHWPRFSDYQRWLRAAYAPDYQPLWVRDGKPTPQANEIIAVLASADDRGLSAVDYDPVRLRDEAARLAGGTATAEDIGLFDTAVTISLMRFISDSYIGKINPRLVDFGLDIEPKKLDLAQVVRELAQDPAPQAKLAELDIPFPLYKRLQKALVQYRALAARTDLPPVPTLPKLKPGDSDPGVPALRARLVAYGDLPADAAAPADPSLYDEALAKGVSHFQRRHGLDPDGVIGPSTLRELQTPPSERAGQIELAMERLRWLPFRFPERFVIVNIPEFRLRGFEAGRTGPALTMEVVVGSAPLRHKTPVLHGEMLYLVFRPYWLVPAGIQRKEILPKAARDKGYLARQNMEIVDGRVRQKPGANNALGLVKFIFPNPEHVYLHDTPSKALFSRSRRDFSHGCIRVADPPALAEFVLRGQQDPWDGPRIEQAMQKGQNDRRVNLQTPVPVYLFYATAIVDEDGQVYFYDDIYGHDAALERMLAKGYPYPY